MSVRHVWIVFLSLLHNRCKRSTCLQIHLSDFLIQVYKFSWNPRMDFCASFISFEHKLQLPVLPLGFARVAPAGWYSLVTVWKVWSPTKKKKKVPCDSSLHAGSLIYDDVRSNWAASVLPLRLSCCFRIPAWKNKEGKDWGKSEAFCHSTSHNPKQRRLTATTNTLEINYLWNRVRASLIFSFYPIKLSNHSKPL